MVVGSEEDVGTTGELRRPQALFVDGSDDIIYIADTYNHRVLAWKRSERSGYIVAGDNGQGSQLNQLNMPVDVILDVQAKVLLICDRGNKRIMKWLLEPKCDEGEILINNVCCFGLAIDKDGNLYVTDREKHEVRRYSQSGDKSGTTVAGSGKRGSALNQLNTPTYVTVDDHKKRLCI